MTAWDRDRAVDRLRALVSAETPSGDPPRLRHAYELVGDWGRQALGRAPELVTERGVPHLLWRAETKPTALILCHVDTVFPAGTIERRPFRQQGDRAFGPGVFDMKAGIVVALDALESLRMSRQVDRIALLVTGDEETGSDTSRRLIEAVASEVSAVLVLEPSLRGDLKVGRKGGSFYELTFRGRAAHAGLEPELGRNALLELAHWARELPTLADPARGTTVTPTVASAGSAQNVVPEQASLTIDVRAATLVELTRVDTAVRDLAARGPQAVEDVEVALTGGVNRPPLEPGGSSDLVGLCQGHARRLGLPVPDTATVGGASDGNFTSALGIPTLDGLGPSGDGAHAEHEWVSVEAMGDRSQLVTALLESLLDGGTARPVVEPELPVEEQVNNAD